jgi:arsenate reductase (glutaredoxin)
MTTTDPLIIYHNPRCSKSRSALALLQERGLTVQIVEYLKTPLSADELRGLMKKLDMKPESLLRRSEAVFKERFAGKTLSDEQWIRAMTDHPILMERPIVMRGNRAVVGRPPDKVLQLV